MADPPPGPDPEAPTPAERRLAELLAEVRGAPVPEAPDLTHRVVRTARWQRGVREALSSIGGLTAALADAAATLLGIRRDRDGGDPR